MNFIGIGYGEILIIIVAGLIIFGPQKLPEVAGQAARWIRDAKKMMTDMTGEFERSAGMKEFKDAIEGEIKGVKKELEEAGLSVKKDLNAAAGSANSALSQAKQSAKGTKPKTTAKSATSTANKSTSSTTSRTTKPKASKADPYAGLVQLVEATPKTKRAAVAPPSSPNGNGSGDVDGRHEPVRETSEAVMRARERRLAAGYNRRIPAP